jgi:hypothetical protein
MLFGETVAVYCENHTEHINTPFGQFSSYLTANTLRLRYRAQPVMPFRETVAVYCENHTEHINTPCGHFSSYLTGNTLRLRYRALPVNDVGLCSGDVMCFM